MKDVRLSDNPIADPAKGGFQRFILVARLANVTVLNGSEVVKQKLGNLVG